MLRRTSIRRGGDDITPKGVRTLIPSPISSWFGPLLQEIGGVFAHKGVGCTSSRYPRPNIRNLGVMPYRGVQPFVADAAFVAPTCLIQGNVHLGHNTVVMYHAMMRNYHGKVPTKIGDNSTVSENTTLIGQVLIDNSTLVGCNCTLDMCEISNNVYVGHGSTICVGCLVERGSIIAPGTMLPQDTRVPPGELWAGNPGRKINDVSPAQFDELQNMVRDAVAIGLLHKKAYRRHVEEGKISKEWFNRVVKQMAERHNEMTPDLMPKDIPIEAMRFLEPKHLARKIETNQRAQSMGNQVADWHMPKWELTGRT